MVKKTLLQWHWALEGPSAQFDSEIGTCTLEAGQKENKVKKTSIQTRLYKQVEKSKIKIDKIYKLAE